MQLNKIQMCEIFLVAKIYNIYFFYSDRFSGLRREMKHDNDFVAIVIKCQILILNIVLANIFHDY